LPDVVPGQVTARTAALLATHRWWSGDDDRSPRAGLHFDVTG
jgi:hypothetical protein